jgi:quercetin dioxygenase-like cupin family protein
MGHGARQSAVVDLLAAARRDTARGPCWSAETTDLDVNLLVFGAGEGVAEHVNGEVDVLLVGVAGQGTVEIEDVAHAVDAGTAVLIPKGVRRAVRGIGAGFTYLTCHRRRAPLRPTSSTPDGLLGGRTPPGPPASRR